MTAKPPKAGRRENVIGIRGPHAERTAAMRKRLIEAAVECLTDLGYGATTLQVVIDRAGASRGAILHHFPSKVDLMIAVAEYAADQQNVNVDNALNTQGPSLERFIEITWATWEAMQQPPAIALLELMMASRSDAELGARLPVVMARLEKHQVDGVRRDARHLGIVNMDTLDAMIWLHLAAMRGLSMELMVSANTKKTEAAMKLLMRYKRWIALELAGKPLS